MGGSGGITFPARKRRAVEPLEAKPPSDRIARKKMLASLGLPRLAIAPPYAADLLHSAASQGQTGTKGESASPKRAREHSNQLQENNEQNEDSLFLASPSVVDGLHSNRSLQAHGHARKGAGNSLLALRESSAKPEDPWLVKATAFEKHTPAEVPRQVKPSSRSTHTSAIKNANRHRHTYFYIRCLSHTSFCPPAMYCQRLCMLVHLLAYSYNSEDG
jgi:hypothetical protein